MSCYFFCYHNTGSLPEIMNQSPKENGHNKEDGVGCPGRPLLSGGNVIHPLRVIPEDGVHITRNPSSRCPHKTSAGYAGT